jgi:hypothetical protein
MRFMQMCALICALAVGISSAAFAQSNDSMMHHQAMKHSHHTMMMHHKKTMDHKMSHGSGSM